MPLVCSQCRRVNPAEAYYCYFDGAALGGRTTSGPVNHGAHPFPSPFVFPSGLQCRNFDQLAMACHQKWPEALDVLKQGFLGSFFGSIGRADLFRAAKEAADYPDLARGLDQLLGKLPSKVLDAPKLKVEPTEANLGQRKVGVDEKLELSLDNQGMRLIHGSVVSDVPWLTLGEGDGVASKRFEFTEELHLPVHLAGKHLRARLKPQEGHLIVESNAGNFIVTFKVDVPPIPFADGILTGALSPRQIAEKAKSNAAGAAPHFESGAVGKWFRDNGLVYPVQGPTAPGVAGVQQFFEALGLAKAPKVEFAVKPIALQGDVGQTFDIPFEVSTQEKKPVYGYVTSSDAPWLDGGSCKPAGKSCTVTLRVTVPDRPGETLEPKVFLHGNGNQKVAIPFRLQVLGEPATAAFTLVEEEPGNPFAMPEPAPFAVPDVPAPAAPPRPVSAPARPASAPRAAALPEGDGDIEFTPQKPTPIGVERSRAWLHAIPAGALALLLVGLVVRDFYAGGTTDVIDPLPRLGLRIDYSSKVDKKVTNSLMFGLEDLSSPGANKRLTFSPLGQTNSVVFLVDDRPKIFGDIKHGRLDGPVLAAGKFGKEATFRFSEDKLEVVQTVKLVAGDPIQVSDGVFKRIYDTCLVAYRVTNKDGKAHRVGARVLLDTYIGMNDGTPFTVPGAAGLVQHLRDYHDKEVPDYLQALEFPDLKNPGTIAHLNLKLGGKYEAPNRVSLTRFPGHFRKNEFEIPLDGGDFVPKGKGPRRIGDNEPLGDDSAIALYWKTDPLGPGKTREFGFTYGLGSVAGEAALSILNPGPIIVGGEFSLVALVADARKGTQATLELPDGMQLVSGPATIEVAASAVDAAGKQQPSPATWRIRALQTGPREIRVRSAGSTAKRVVTVSKSSVF